MKDFIESVDNWTLIKILGGLSIILSSIISFFAYFIKEHFNNRWKSKYQSEIEKLKSNLNQNNDLLNNLTSSISNIYLASNEKRIESIDKVWSKMTEIKGNMPTIAHMTYSILTKEETENLPQTSNEFFVESINAFKPQTYFENHHKIVKEIEKTRPFIGEKLWVIFFVYQSFLGRLIYLIQDGLEKGTVKYWKDDDPIINQILPIVINSKELKELLDPVFAFNNIVNFIEAKALNEISEQITGKRMTEETVEHAIKLSKMTINTVA